MKRLALSLFLSGVVFAAAAQTPATSLPQAVAPTDTVAADIPAADASAADADADGNLTAKATRVDKACVQQTGSRIRVKNQEGKCNGEHGSAYSREVLLRTGRPDMGAALRALDTSVN